MTESEIQSFFENWTAGTKKIFSYKREWVPAEYLLLTYYSDGSIRVDAEESTYFLKIYNKDQLVPMLKNKVIEFHKDWSYGSSLKHIKTGGCECGAWITKDKYHSNHCPIKDRKW